jgi:adenine deaminase
MIAPGRWADVVLVGDLLDFRAGLVIAKGRIMAENGKSKVQAPRYAYPAWALNSVHLRRAVKAADFALKAGGREARVRAHVIGVIENQAPTRHLTLNVRTEKGEVKPDIDRDLAKLAVIQRHGGPSRVSVGLVSGFGLTERCAIASTIAHDCHQLIVVGTDEEDMATAANKLAKIGGGQIVVKNGQVIGLVELGIAGLMSNDRVELVARKAQSVLEGFKACGCHINNPNMQLSLLALPVIPELRLSDKGLVDVTRFEFIPVLEKA